MLDKKIHGENPRLIKVSTMSQFSIKLDKREYSHFSRKYESNEIDYLRLKEGAALFRGTFLMKNYLLLTKKTKTHGWVTEDQLTYLTFVFKFFIVGK